MEDFYSRPSSNGKKLDLELFKDAMKHLVPISRIIGMTRVHALLVGVGGSGKQCLARLASTILDCQIAPGRNYSIRNQDFLGDLRELYRRADVLNKQATF